MTVYDMVSVLSRTVIPDLVGDPWIPAFPPEADCRAGMTL